MTVTRSSRNNEPIVTPCYIGYSIKRSWAVALLIFIALFFATSVPLMMSLGEIDRYYIGYDQTEIIVRVKNIFHGVIVSSVVVSSLAAFFTGSFSLSFLHNKVSAGFFHSLPEKRSGHYLAALISSVTVFAGPLVLNTFILFLTSLSNGFIYAYVIKLIFKLFAFSLFYYIVFLGISYFAGALTGSVAIHTLLSIYIPLIVPVTIFAVCLWVDTGVIYLRTDTWDIIENIGVAITPIARIAETIVEKKVESAFADVIYILIDVVITAALFVGAYFIYKKRPVERAGTPIIYKPVSEFVKYSIMFPATFLMGYLFSELGGGLWLIFGAVAGAVLSFMLMNTILNRSAKAMFRGAKGFAVFSVVTVLSIVTTLTGLFGYADYHVPNAKEITITVDGTDYKLSKDEITVFRSLMKEFNEGLRSGEIDRNVEYYEYGEVIVNPSGGKTETESIDSLLNDLIAKGEYYIRTADFRVKYKNYLGINSEYAYYSFNYSDIIDILDFVAKSEAYNSSLPIDDSFTLVDINFASIFPAEIVERIGIFEGYFMDDLIGTAGYDFSMNLYSRDMETEMIMKSLSGKLAEFIRDHMTESTTKQVIGRLSYDGLIGVDQNDNKYIYKSIPLYAEDIPTLLLMIDDILPYMEIYITDRFTGEGYSVPSKDDGSTVIFDELMEYDADDYIDEQTNIIEFALIIDHADKTAYKITEKDKIREVVAAASQITSYAEISSFAPTDSDYTVVFITNGNFDSFVAYFYPDKLPSFLK